MLRYKLEEKKSFCCEVCGANMAARKTTAISVNEFYKDGTIKIHYACSKHMSDLYNKIVKGIENK